MVPWAIVVNIASTFVFAITLYHKIIRPKMLDMDREILEWEPLNNVIKHW